MRWRILVLGCALAAAACSLLVDSGGLDGEDDASLDGGSSGEDAAPNLGDGSPTVDSGSGGDGSLATDGGGDGSAGSLYAQEVLADQPVAYFRFGEASGAVFAKDERSQLAGNIEGAVTPGAAGAIKGDPNGAFSFDGGKIRVSRKIAFPGYAPYTLEAWVKPAVVDQGFRQVINRVTGSPSNGYAVWVYEGVGVGSDRNADGSSDNVYAYVTPPSTKFTHVAIVCDGTTMKAYIDTVEKAVDPALTRAFLDVAGDLIIGGNKSGDSTNAFIGELDEIAIYDKALSLVRLQAHYAKANGQ